MWIMTAEGWKRPEPAVVQVPPKQGNHQVYWWMGLCPINPNQDK